MARSRKRRTGGHRGRTGRAPTAATLSQAHVRRQQLQADLREAEAVENLLRVGGIPMEPVGKGLAKGEFRVGRIERLRLRVTKARRERTAARFKKRMLSEIKILNRWQQGQGPRAKVKQAQFVEKRSK